MQNIEKQVSLKNMSFLKPWKQITFFVIGLVGLIIIELVAQLLLISIARLAYGNTYLYDNFVNSSLASMILNGSSYLILGIIFIILIKEDDNELFKSFKGWKPYVAAAIGLASIMIFNVIYNLILSATGAIITDNANETSLNTMVTTFPFTSILIFAFVGPICEELTYRVGLFSFMRRINVYLAYIVTIIVFTLIHFDFTSQTMTNELLNIPFYAFAAITFCFLYERFGFAASVTSHVANNLISVLATILSVFK